MSNRRAFFELFIASAMWGFGFTATIWALTSFSPLNITALRFGAAAILGALFILPTARRKELNWKNLKLAFVPGFYISATLIAQTWGLQYTTATKSAFLTTLYVLIVPALEKMFFKSRLPRFHFVFVAIALLGVALICNLGNDLSSTQDLDRIGWNRGDVMTLICAFFASLQIEWFGRHQKQIQSAFVFNTLQSFWAAAVALIALLSGLAGEALPHTAPNQLAIAGLGALTFGSTMIAFALQVRAQKHLSPSIASLLFLLESPFSALFAFLILGDVFHWREISGAVLIFAAVLASTWLNASTPAKEA